MSFLMKDLPANPGNYGGTRSASEIKYLVIHYTGNNGDSAVNNARYFQDNLVKSSAHYFVDDTTVYRSVPDLKVAWAVGGALYSDVSKTGGGTMYGIITNRNSISIELCDTLRDDTYQASEQTLENAVQLCRQLMAQYELPVSRVYRHFDVTGKRCPRYFVEESAWRQFKARLEDNTVTQKQFNQMMAVWLKQQAAGAASAASHDARQWAEENGIVTGFSDGTKQYKGFCTREQVVLMLHRFLKTLNPN